MNKFQNEVMAVQSASDKLSIVATDLIDTLNNQSRVLAGWLDYIDALEGVDYKLDSLADSISFDYPSIDSLGNAVVKRFMYRCTTDANDMILSIEQGHQLPESEDIIWVPIWAKSVDVPEPTIPFDGTFLDPLTGLPDPKLTIDQFSGFLSQARNNVQVLVDAVSAAQAGTGDVLARFASITGSWISQVSDSSLGLYNEIINNLNTVGESTSGIVSILQGVYGNFNGLHLGSRNHTMEFNTNNYHVSGFIGQMLVNTIVPIALSSLSSLLSIITPVLGSLGMVLVNLGNQIGNVWQQLGDSTYASASSNSDNYLFAVPLHQGEYFYSGTLPATAQQLRDDLIKYGSLTIIHPSWITLYWGVYDNDNHLIGVREETYARWSGAQSPQYGGGFQVATGPIRDVNDVKDWPDDSWVPHFYHATGFEVRLMTCSDLVFIPDGNGGYSLSKNPRDYIEDRHYNRLTDVSEIAQVLHLTSQDAIDKEILRNVAENVIATYCDTICMGFTQYSKDYPLQLLDSVRQAAYNRAINNGSWSDLVNNVIYPIRELAFSDPDDAYSRLHAAYYNYMHQEEIYPTLTSLGWKDVILKATTLPSRSEFYLCPPRYDKGIRFKLIFAIASVAIAASSFAIYRAVRRVRIRRKMAVEYAQIASDYEDLAKNPDNVKDLQKRVRKYNRKAKWYGMSTLSYLNGWENGDAAVAPSVDIDAMSSSLDGLAASFETTANTVSQVKRSLYGDVLDTDVVKQTSDAKDTTTIEAVQTRRIVTDGFTTANQNISGEAQQTRQTVTDGVASANQNTSNEAQRTRQAVTNGFSALSNELHNQIVTEMKTAVINALAPSLESIEALIRAQVESITKLIK